VPSIITPTSSLSTNADINSWLVKTLRKQSRDSKLAIAENTIRLTRSIERHWLKKHGKGHYISFDSEDRINLKRMFREVDIGNKGFLT
jgi:hypothetical protein